MTVNFVNTTLIFGAYILTRTVNLLSIPIFNDEAIYLDWGWIMTHRGQLFLSLMDGKQPLFMWLLGLAQSFPLDSLLLGRLVSMCFGLGSLLALYFTCRKFLSEKVWWLTGVLYVCSPLFLFFDRQALMESSLTCIGIWIFYLSVNIAKTYKANDLLMLCLLWAASFWIKSTGLIFIVASIIIFLFSSRRKARDLMLVFVELLLAGVLLIPLYIQPNSAMVFTLNDRFSLTFLEIIKLPLGVWSYNFWSVVETIFWQVSALGLFGFFTLSKHSYPQVIRAATLWLFVVLSCYIGFTRGAQMRYLTALVPLFCLITGYLLAQYKLIIYPIVTIVPLVLLSSLQIFRPLTYFKVVTKLNPSAKANQYFQGFTSGYGINEVLDEIARLAKEDKTLILMGLNLGNPNNAVNVYVRNNPQYSVKLIHPGSSLSLTTEAALYKNIYFISRDQETYGLKNLSLIEEFYKPGRTSQVGLYQLTTNR